MQYFEKLIKILLPQYKYANITYSQEGEDMILQRFLERQKKGFFVDIGAHHPFRFSNTAFFYRKGWNGINVEPMPIVAPLFRRYRSRDINIQAGVSESKGELKYYIFEETALNTFSESKANEYITEGVKLVKSIPIQTLPLADILDTYLPENGVIDFLSIDTEGLEMEVLRSNNWDKYQPKFIVLESHIVEIKKYFSSELNTYLEQLGYQLVAKTYYSYIYTKC